MAAKVYTLEQVEKHNTKDDLWFILHDKVYDVSKFIAEVNTFLFLPSIFSIYLVNFVF